jgi:hypothetical protein
MRYLVMLVSLVSLALVTVLVAMAVSVYAGKSWEVHVSFADPARQPVAATCPQPKPGAWFDLAGPGGDPSCHAVSFR